MRNVVGYLAIGILVSSNLLYAQSFEQKHHSIISDIIWAADKAEVPRDLLLAVCYGESTFRTDSKLTHMDGNTLSFGICQIKLSLAQDMDKIFKHKNKVTPAALMTPRINAFYAAKALKFHLRRYNDNWKLAVDAYNKYNAVSEDSAYVKNVSKNLDLIKNNVTAARH